ncbi:MAG TPA: carboxyl transferase domain-containing protein [Acidimicrobiales bacterium]|nr:carboxyl transferase domain-containing protein [Acidimicrobiales bacterium]
MKTVLVANRGEVAVRVIRAAAALGLRSVAVASDDDRSGLATRMADETRRLDGSGPAAYLQIEALATIAGELPDCGVHPGYGFLSENPEFARACATRGATFIGPTPNQLSDLGDKTRARNLARLNEVPVLPGTGGPVDERGAREFLAGTGSPVMLKAVAGGGGRGMRVVDKEADMADAFARARSEAERAFGDGRLYVEQLLTGARHIEVQVIGDGTGAVVELGERDCTLQRRNQKLIEIAPSPFIGGDLRSALIGAAVRMAASLALCGAATFEFLVDAEGREYYFLEANPRLQVEHTVTEQVTGVDIVQAQIAIASGQTLAQMGLDAVVPRGYAIQARVNAETQPSSGPPLPGSGTLTEFSVPTGPGVRVDTCGHRGLEMGTAFDSLLAKVVVGSFGSSFDQARRSLVLALSQFEIAGVATNLSFLRAVLDRPELAVGEVSTTWVNDRLAELVEAAAAVEPLDAAAPEMGDDLPTGTVAVTAPVQGEIVQVTVQPGENVVAGQEIAVVEAMKMQYPVTSPMPGTVQDVLATIGAAVRPGDRIAVVAVSGVAGEEAAGPAAIDLDRPRADLDEVRARHDNVTDGARPDAVARRRAKSLRTARENVADLLDGGVFHEYGPLVVANQRRRRSMEDLIRRTPADGVVAGFGLVNGDHFAADRARALVIAFDDTVLAGTMGEQGRDKIKRTLEVAARDRRPVVLFAEGGGGRAGDSDGKVFVTGWTMDVSVYYQFSRLSGLVPLVGVAAGRTFAANSGLLACADVIIATADANIGVGGPAMVEGGRLGTFTPEELGPMSVQGPNGTVDLIVHDEAAAVAAAKKYLSYFQGPVADWACADQRTLRHRIPEDRQRAYDIRSVIEALVDSDSVLELRRQFGIGVVTCLARIEGRPVGVIANNPYHLGGAVDSDAADKASRFMRLCDAFDVPLLMLCDTPGMMVGPDAEREAAVRKMGRMFVTASNLDVPLYTVVLRKAYGLGAELMAGGWFRAGRLLLSWPTGEFGGMNIEGNVVLGFSGEMARIEDPAERQAFFDAKVAELYETGHAVSVATHYEVDDVIDPAETRSWISSAMAVHVAEVPRRAKKIPYVDPW